MPAIYIVIAMLGSFMLGLFSSNPFELMHEPFINGCYPPKAGLSNSL